MLGLLLLYWQALERGSFSFPHPRSFPVCPAVVPLKVAEPQNNSTVLLSGCFWKEWDRCVYRDPARERSHQHCSHQLRGKQPRCNSQPRKEGPGGCGSGQEPEEAESKPPMWSFHTPAVNPQTQKAGWCLLGAGGKAVDKREFWGGVDEMLCN